MIAASGIHSSRLHVVMYSMLLVATPFVLLQNFLVEEISRLSVTAIELGSCSVPVLPIIALIILTGLLILLRKKLTWLRIAGVGVVLGMITLAQQITDFYFNHNFYDLQQNWHFIAYGLFAYMMYRDLAPRQIPVARIMLLTYLIAIVFSTFDETFQMNMSSRIFDVSDIAKDLWGTLMGIILIYLWTSAPQSLKSEWRLLRPRSMRTWFSHTPSLLVLMMAFALFLLCYGSLFSDFEYWWQVVLLTIGSFAGLFLILHLSRYKTIAGIMVVGLTCIAILQTYLYVRYRSDNIVHNEHGLTVYRGLVIPLFDVMIYPDGAFRLVDKKHYFNSRDLEFLLKEGPDIILIGSGSEGKGGQGFPKDAAVQFIYNPYTQRGTQVIILKTPEACEVFNRLKQGSKNVLFVLHNTC